MAKPHGDVVFISPDNVVLHVGDVDRILPHLGIITHDNLNLGGAVLPEMYDATGQRLEIVEPAEGKLELARIDARAEVNEQLLIDRITLALARMQVAVHKHPDKDMRSFRVPMIQGSLPVVLAGLAEAFGPLADDADPGDPDTGGSMHRASTHPHS